MTLNQFKKIHFPVLPYLCITETGKNETKYNYSFHITYNENIYVNFFYDVHSATWNDKKKCYTSKNGDVILVIKKGDKILFNKRYNENCKLETLQNELLETLQNLK